MTNILTVKGESFIAELSQKCSLCRQQIANTLTVNTVQRGYVHEVCRQIYNVIVTEHEMPELDRVGTQAQMISFVKSHPYRTLLVRFSPDRPNTGRYSWKSV